jgi:NADH-quinone oxidoreductase subunit J
MSLQILFFWTFAIASVSCAVGVIFSRNTVASALFLVGSLFTLAGLFLSLHAPFIAAIQVLVYAGAVMVLFIFVMMLLNLQQDDELFTRSNIPAMVKYVVLTTLLLSICALIYLTAYPLAVEQGASGFTVAEIANLLFTKYLFPFELASYLLLVAMVGGVVLAKKSE